MFAKCYQLERRNATELYSVHISLSVRVYQLLPQQPAASFIVCHSNSIDNFIIHLPLDKQSQLLNSLLSLLRHNQPAALQL